MTVTALLLTRFFRSDADFHEWCRHHFSVGIDHIHIFDDDTSFDLEKSSAEYGDMISYERVSRPKQYQLYNRYIPECSSDYVMPIDDDEYLWVSPELGNIKTAIKYYSEKLNHMNVLGIRWLYRFPKVFHSERNCGVLEYCTEENDYLASRFVGPGNAVIKCLLRKNAFVRYMDADESRERNHIPVTAGMDGAIMCDGSWTIKQYVPGKIEDEQIRLIHCPYKGYSEYMEKQSCHFSVSHSELHQRHYGAFNMILDRLP